jgi:predicted dehydrogenase
VIIGAGGIGSRHLQGLRSVRQPVHVHLVDPSEDALGVARARWDEAPGEDHHRLTSARGTDSLQGTPSIVLVATTSLVRAQVVREALERAAPRHLVLEKFLFPVEDQYAEVADLVTAAGAAAWVNTARRMWPGYTDLRAQLDSEGPVSLRVAMRPEHGVGSNAVHFLDLLSHLTGRPSGDLDGSGLVPIENRRRRGSIEFEGTVSGYNEAGDHFGLSTLRGSTAPPLVQITTAREHVVIDEAGGQQLRSAAASDWRWAQTPFASAFQSQLTGQLAEDLLEHDRCALPTLAEATSSHLSLLRAFLASYRTHVDQDATACPVT